VYIDFPVDARIATIKEALNTLKLKHTDEAGQEHLLRISSDLPLAVRHKARVLGELWKLVEAYVSGLPAAKQPKDFKLGNSNGKLFLIQGHRPLALFELSFDDHSNMHINPHLTNLSKLQISDDMARSWAASAVRSVARSGQ
jgi:hypothetical protein